MKKFLLSLGILSFLGLISFSSLAKPSNSKYDSIFKQIEKIRVSHADEARALLDKLYQDSSNTSLYTKAVYLETLLNYSQGIKDTSLDYKIQKAEALLKDNPQSFENALIGYANALNYTIVGNYAKSFTFALTTLENFKHLNDSVYISKILNLLGNICYNIRSFNLSKSYYDQAIQFVKKGTVEYYGILINLYSSHNYDSIHLKKATDSLSALIPTLKKYQDTGLLVGAYLNLSACYLETGGIDQSLDCLNKATKLIETIDNYKLTVVLYLGFGTYNLYREHYKEACDYYLKAKSFAEECGMVEPLSMILYNLSSVYKKRGNLDSAFFYLSEYEKLNEKLINSAKAIEAYREYVSVYLEASQNKLTIASQEAEIRKRQLTITIVLGAGIVLLIVMILIVVQQQKRNIQQHALLKETENRELTERLRQRQEIQKLQEEKNKLQEEKHKELMESKSREITSYTLLLSNKNNILQQIADLISQIPQQSKELSEVRNIVKSNLNTDSEWEDFMLHFDKVHPSFFNHLKQKSDNLTENNLRLCAYFRISMPIKQIAKILNVSPDSISVQRHRLKKKFGLGENDSLDDFLRNI